MIQQPGYFLVSKKIINIRSDPYEVLFNYGFEEKIRVSFTPISVEGSPMGSVRPTQQNTNIWL